MVLCHTDLFNPECDRLNLSTSMATVVDTSSDLKLPYLTRDQADALSRTKADGVEFDRWRHLPTLELHYYPRGTGPARQSDYVRYLP